MKTITFDSGFVLDDPNSYWGDPSYQLQPGDPGYVPSGSQLNPKPRRKHMRRQRWFPSRSGDQVTFLNNFSTKLPIYATAFGLPAGTVTAVQADCAWLAHVLGTWLPAVRTFAESCTGAANDAQTTDGTGAMTLPTFTAPTAPTAVAAGVLNRLFNLVQTIQDSPGYTETMGSDLGIVGSEDGAPDFSTFAPVLKITRAPAGVTVGWGWQGKSAFLDMIELQVDRGTGFQLLAYDTTPGYVDSEPIPATPTKWKYRGIYRVGDQRVGQWSAEATVVVGG